MIQNLGTPDRIIRLIAGVVLLALPALLHLAAWESIAAWLAGIILIATASFRFCPIYAALRFGRRQRRDHA